MNNEQNHSQGIGWNAAKTISTITILIAAFVFWGCKPSDTANSSSKDSALTPTNGNNTSIQQANIAKTKEPVPPILMSRSEFEKVFGSPSVTSDQFNQTFKDKYGLSLWDFISYLKVDDYAMLDGYKEKVKQLVKDRKNLDKGDMAALIKCLADGDSATVGSDTWPPCDWFHPGSWENDIIYELWLITRNQGVENVSYAEYQTDDSKIRAFYLGDKLLLMIENRAAIVSKGNWNPRTDEYVDKDTDWSAWRQRFQQIEGGDPISVRTNLDYPSNSALRPKDPLQLYDSCLLPSDLSNANVTFLGTNYFGQLVGYDYTQTQAYTHLIIGDASFLYPLILKNSEEQRHSDEAFYASRHAEMDELNRRIDRENARAALIDAIRNRENHTDQ